MITRRGWMAAAGSAAAMAWLSKRGQRAVTMAGKHELCARAWDGLGTRIRGHRYARGYARRLDTELAALTSNVATVRKLLALSDMAMWARRDGIPVGPGRGSAPASLVCWALGITGVDPIRYDLVFERFYPSAKEPLVDLHVCARRRDELLDQLAAHRAEDDAVAFELIGHEILTVLGTIADTEPLGGTDVWRFLASGATEAVYQLEDVELRRLLRRVEPESLEDVAATIALHRPGPIEAGWVDELVAARHRRRKIDPMHPAIAAILAPTRGLLVYEEQLIRIVADVSGLSLTASNQVRRDLAARRYARIEAHRDTFVAGAERRGCSTRTALAIFARLERDATYTFTRAHAVAETTLTLRSARHVLANRLSL